eukprot:97400-Prorocentrum_minimum.AAC.1
MCIHLFIYLFGCCLRGTVRSNVRSCCHRCGEDFKHTLIGDLDLWIASTANPYTDDPNEVRRRSLAFCFTVGVIFTYLLLLRMASPEGSVDTATTA